MRAAGLACVAPMYSMNNLVIPYFGSRGLVQMSGGNLLVPIIAHVVYDLLTFLEVHQRATAQLEVNMSDLSPEKQVVSQDYTMIVIFI